MCTGERLAYDRLILALGSSAMVPRIDGFGGRGTFVVRSAEDALSIRGFAQREWCREALIAGGGLLGLEAGYALHKLGLHASILFSVLSGCCAASSTSAPRSTCGATSKGSA